MQNPVREALVELVRLKNINNRLEGRGYNPQGITRDFDAEALHEEYEAGKGPAWEAAEAALALPAPEPVAWVNQRKPIGFVYLDDLRRLKRNGMCQLYEVEQDFKLMPPQDAIPVYAAIEQEEK